MMTDKKKIRAGLLEGLAEIVLAFICFGIGVLIISLFGVSLDSLNMDIDLIILIGIAVLAIIFGIVFALVQWFKKIIGGRRK